MSAADFYDQMAPFYHLLFQGELDDSFNYHGWAMDQIIRRKWGDGVIKVLDLSCGIGTQALGLAQRGYQVTASDISARAVDRARREAAERRLDVSFSVANMLQARDHHPGQYDVVLAVENAVPHLLSDEEILQAFRQFYACCRPGGGCVISVRDYENEDPTSPQIRPYSLKVTDDAKYLLFQVWEFDGPIYDVSLYIVRDDGRSMPETHVFRTKYYAVTIPTLMEILAQAGFTDIDRLDDMYFQPTLVATRPEDERDHFLRESSL
jgi:2-polyprenyl-3-methyl-5-hydroxy-6-metoxy-1,4-benzoquinol methylase